jgi:hypothetical protein
MYEQMLCALNQYLMSRNCLALFKSEFDIILTALRQRKKVEAIKLLRTNTANTIEPPFKNGVNGATNEFFNFLMLDDDHKKMVDNTHRLGLKQAKDVIDVLETGLHHLN